ncbi:MAG: DUF1294 domain-containing protein [Dorea sp.]|jgi:uncharacterized membrane protein YsdA (DUF1294 family)|nr:DUF1294 domain-containing protein [Dorea sp.]
MSIGGMYLAVINAVGFGIFGYDKWCAVHRQWRVPEKTLIAAALLGGSVGAYAGMKVFRHKTRHPKFSVGLPVILAAQCAAAVMLRFL